MKKLFRLVSVIVSSLAYCWYSLLAVKTAGKQSVVTCQADNTLLGVLADTKLFGNGRENSRIKGFEVDMAKALWPSDFRTQRKSGLVQVTSSTRMPLLKMEH